MNTLTDYVMVKQIIRPANYGSAAHVASDNATNPVIDGYDRALFILNVGSVGSDDTLDVAIQWASSGSGSDCAEITGATDAFFAQVDSDGINTIYTLELDFAEAAMETGVLGAAATCADSDTYFSLTCLLYGGTRTLPPTQDQTKVKTY